MKNIILCLSMTMLAAGVANASVHVSTPKQIPSMELDMTGEEYRGLLKARYHRGDAGTDSSLDDIIQMGTRNLDWLKAINAARPANSQLSFTSAATQTNIPIDHAKKYSGVTIRKDYQDLMAGIPTAMKSVLLGDTPVSANLPISDADYIFWGHKADAVYQNAARWTMYTPYLDELVSRQVRDVRGYYFLSRDANREQNFANFDSIQTDVQANYKEWMIELCSNTTGEREGCTSEVAQSVSNHALSAMYAKYAQGGLDLWNSYFTIPDGIKSSAAATSADGLITTVLFKDPQNQAVHDYLQKNIEDEWHWNNWALKLAFKKVEAIAQDASDLAQGMVDLIFQPGSTPHVPGLGVNQIIMDGNAPLTEYNVQWTIRHEFGHVLGFPDCYLEFYDPNEKVIVSYQHDVTNLMCARTGHLKETHYNEMKRVYVQ